MLTDRQIKLIVGSLLHDIGKVVFRSGDGRNHSLSGMEYLEKEAGISDKEILNCVRYHHGKYLAGAALEKDDLAYITYFADNVAAFTDRREADFAESGFDKSMPLDSVFNILNNNHGHSHYTMQVLNPKESINYPTDRETVMDQHFYKTVVQNITDNLKGIELSEEYVNSLLSVMEANLTYIPSSTSKKELADISLFDHVKMTAAIAACVEQYFNEKQKNDYEDLLLHKAQASYAEEMFLLYSMDISGIQSFIYSIADKGALKGLRARSFYLEIMMEHIVDELLEELSLSRANLIYSGGGHCYMLLPNTDRAVQIVEQYEYETNQWFRDTFDISLYIACGYARASANVLRNEPEGSYEELYKNISSVISKKKSHRYDAQMIRTFNSQSHEGERECAVCRRIAVLTNDKCAICNALEKMGAVILNADYFTILCEPAAGALPLPGDRYLIAEGKKELQKHMDLDSYVRCYTKNDFYTGRHVTNKMWVGDYVPSDVGRSFEELAENARGIKRIAVLRADVDNLGSSFVHGFKRGDDDKYATISRTAALSRQLSLFFKGYINKILEENTSTIFGDEKTRKVVIVYSGGDDVFLAGAWNDVIASYIDLREALEKFTVGSLTISGGIGVYTSTYPINVMAKDTQRLEELSKNVEGKDAITLWNEDHSYPWKEFRDKVVGEKMQTLEAYFGDVKDKEAQGMSFLYRLTDLLRNQKEKVNIARYVYLLSRMEPGDDSDRTVKEKYRNFSEKMYRWSQNETDKRELITAIYLYVYLNREQEGD